MVSSSCKGCLEIRMYLALSLICDQILRIIECVGIRLIIFRYLDLDKELLVFGYREPTNNSYLEMVRKTYQINWRCVHTTHVIKVYSSLQFFDGFITGVHGRQTNQIYQSCLAWHAGLKITTKATRKVDLSTKAKDQSLRVIHFFNQVFVIFSAEYQPLGPCQKTNMLALDILIKTINTNLKG